MADGQPNTTAPAPAVNAPAPAVGPNLGGLIQPGAGTITPGSAQDLSNQQQAALNSEQGEAGKAQAAESNIQRLSQPQAPAAPPKHATLLRMVEGLGIALSSSATALSTKGKEGGAPEVQEYYAKKQEQNIQAQQANQAVRNAQIQQQITALDTAHKMGQMYHLLSMAPDEFEASNLKVQSEKLGLQTQQIENTKAAADFRTQYGVSPEQFNSLMSGQATDPEAVKGLEDYAGQRINAAAEILGADNPEVTQAHAVLDNPNSKGSDIMNAVGRLNRAVALSGQVVSAKEAQAKLASTQSLIQQRSDLFAKIDTNPKILDDPATQAKLGAIFADPNSTPEQKAKAAAYIDQAKKANAAFVKQQKDIASARGEAYAGAKGVPVIDQDGFIRIVKTEDAETQHLTPLQGGSKAMAAQAQLTDMRVASKNLRGALIENKGTQFSPAAVAKITAAMKESDPTVMKNEIKNLAASDLTPAQQNLVTWLAQMQERVLSLRNIAGMGQGSDLTRLAIMNTLPDVTSGNNQLALKKLDAIDNMMDNLQKGIPKVNLNPSVTAPVESPAVKASDFTRPANVSPQAKLMQVPGGKPHWIEPANQAAAAKAGAVEVQ